MSTAMPHLKLSNFKNSTKISYPRFVILLACDADFVFKVIGQTGGVG